MEENRLKPMVDGYDEKLFNELYEQTAQLRKKLASQIDSRRFGVDYKEILSWFDIKFIFTFNKYFGSKDKDLLKGYIISSLQFFKNRILRSSYSKKAQVYNTIDIEEVYNLQETTIEHEYDEKQVFLQIALDFMKSRLSYEAYQILVIELNPPFYILDQIAKHQKYTTTKIPSSIIADYLGLDGTEGVKYVNKLRKEIQGVLTIIAQNKTQLITLQ